MNSIIELRIHNRVDQVVDLAVDIDNFFNLTLSHVTFNPLLIVFHFSEATDGVAVFVNL